MVGMMVPMKREGETYFGLALAHHLCVKKTLTAKELAAATGISASFISQIASRTRNASQENQVAIAEALPAWPRLSGLFNVRLCPYHTIV